jgi:transposase
LINVRPANGLESGGCRRQDRHNFRLRRKDVLSFFGSLPPWVVGLEACGSAHHWARELVELGHDARPMPPNYVKAYVCRQKE